MAAFNLEKIAIAASIQRENVARPTITQISDHKSSRQSSAIRISHPPNMEADCLKPSGSVVFLAVRGFSSRLTGASVLPPRAAQVAVAVVIILDLSLLPSLLVPTMMSRPLLFPNDSSPVIVARVVFVVFAYNRLVAEDRCPTLVGLDSVGGSGFVVVVIAVVGVSVVIVVWLSLFFVGRLGDDFAVVVAGRSAGRRGRRRRGRQRARSRRRRRNRWCSSGGGGLGRELLWLRRLCCLLIRDYPPPEEISTMLVDRHMGTFNDTSGGAFATSESSIVEVCLGHASRILATIGGAAGAAAVQPLVLTASPGLTIVVVFVVVVRIGVSTG
mmetsp:Transcript_67674/g.141429  ORF Transcript_67674/g.141429 Transcript_67674/m.141429 type:complete len:328 (+) Transcript_67674:111-1094(+)